MKKQFGFLVIFLCSFIFFIQINGAHSKINKKADKKASGINLKIEWSRQSGTSHDEKGASLTVNNKGLIYVIVNDKYNDTANHNTPKLICYSKTGVKQFQKVINISESIDYSYAVDIQKDKNGFMYILGFRGTFSPMLLSPCNIFSGQHLYWIAKYSPAGMKIWSRIFYHEKKLQMRTLAVNKTGTIYVGGNIRGNYVQSHSGTYAFIAKHNISGLRQWILPIYENSDIYMGHLKPKGFDSVMKINIDQFNNIFVTGYFQSKTYKSKTKGHVYHKSYWIKVFRPNQQLKWSKLITRAGYLTYPFGIKINKRRFVVTGFTYPHEDDSNQDSQSFIAMYEYKSDFSHDPQLMWYKKIGAIKDNIVDHTYSLDVNNKYIYIAGNTGETQLFRKNWIAVLNWKGELLHKKVFGSQGGDFTYKIFAQNDNTLYITGLTTGTIYKPDTGSTGMSLYKLKLLEKEYKPQKDNGGQSFNNPKNLGYISVNKNIVVKHEYVGKYDSVDFYRIEMEKNQNFHIIIKGYNLNENVRIEVFKTHYSYNNNNIENSILITKQKSVERTINKSVQCPKVDYNYISGTGNNPKEKYYIYIKVFPGKYTVTGTYSLLIEGY